MKDKNLAGVLALFFGWAGVHRFYLGQVGLGILYIFMMPVAIIISFIDAIVFFAMATDNFNIKYNKEYFETVRVDRKLDKNANRNRQKNERQAPPRSNQNAYQVNTSNAARQQELKKNGIEKYKDYDYDGAIEDFLQALELDPRDISIHFNLACTYSLNENAERAFFHLDKAVSLGFNDFKKIKAHDALAFLRIQDGFEAFEKNNFRLAAGSNPTVQNAKVELPPEDHSPILEQLKKLNDLRQRGLLTEEEFDLHKKKLIN
jgi:TM2 domain-containing membrane protein YozV